MADSKFLSTEDTLKYSSRQASDKRSGLISKDSESSGIASLNTRKPKLPLGWRIAILTLTCLASFGNHWSNGLIVALKTTIIKEVHINNSQFATLVACTNLVNTFLCIGLGFCIDTWGGPLFSVIMALFHLSGSIVMAGSATNNFNNYPVLIVGKVLAAIGDGSLDNAQHRIFSTYFARGGGFAFSIGAIWGVANLAQFTGQSTANIIATNLGTYAWALWISAIIALFSVICAVAVYVLDKWLVVKYEVTDHTDGATMKGHLRRGVFSLKAVRQLPVTFWIVVLFSVFENAGVQSFVSISTQFAQQRLKKGAVIGGWVSSFYLLLPACLTPVLGIVIDLYGQRVSFLFVSALMFLISMLLLKFSHSVPTFIAAYVFYALAQCVTPAPQVEIIRSIIADPQWFATAFAIKKSVVQASIVIITTAAGKLQDDTANDSLDPAVTLWLVYAFVCTAVSGALWVVANWFPTPLPAARLSQVKPSRMQEEVKMLLARRAHTSSVGSDIDIARVDEGEKEDGADDDGEFEEKKLLSDEKALKKAKPGMDGMRWIFLVASAGIIAIGWIMFGLGVEWGVHGSVIAGTTGE
ncbi:MFS general substrate transporter [Lentinula edodes]|uniref:MFS general substrate transporter n=1 Tax=Lentinula edodes TaxID=5353 RepID=UPI001E8CC7A7|nr:MFS general substrate transporter [Lentinula edodes]KAH7879291.1 MFS general substrate transporter [Lentinula edodes]